MLAARSLRGDSPAGRKPPSISQHITHGRWLQNFPPQPPGILSRLKAQQSCRVSQQASGPKPGADCFPHEKAPVQRCCENSLGEGVPRRSPSSSLGQQPAPMSPLPQLGCHRTMKGGGDCPPYLKGTYRTTSTAPARTLGSLPMMETLAVKEPSMLNTTDSVPRATTVRYASA